MRRTFFALIALTGCDATVVGGGPDGQAPDGGGAVDAAKPPDLACVPQCANRNCGDDGCNGTCGTCQNGESCVDPGKCVPQCPCFFGQCNNCYCATAAEDYASKNNCYIAGYQGNEGDLLNCAGPNNAPAAWSVGQKCANGCIVAPPMVPDYCAPPPGMHKLWIAFDGATAGAMNHTRDFFNCVFQHSNFNTLATGYQTGRSFGGVGGVAVLNNACATVHPWWCASVDDDSTTIQCIEDQTNWPLEPDDIILYYPVTATKNGCDTYVGGCSDGRNHWHIPVHLGNGTALSVEVAFGFTGGGQNCQTALGSHEVYEAAAESDAADCCNGQKNCAGHEPDGPFGWYSANGCNQTWELQNFSPAGQVWNPAACTKLTFM